MSLHCVSPNCIILVAGNIHWKTEHDKMIKKYIYIIECIVYNKVSTAHETTNFASVYGCAG